MTTESERPRIPGGPVKFEPDFLRLVQEMPAGPIKVVTAIPWCTTHDDRATYSQDECQFVQQYGHEPEDSLLHEAFELTAQFISGGAECVISTGGPDHKWWKNTA